VVLLRYISVNAPHKRDNDDDDDDDNSMEQIPS
jgi:hypothetical protein